MWSMPLSVRKVVAVIVGLCAIGGFVMGFASVPEKSHLPGEGLPGSTAPVIDAEDAKPLEPNEPQVAAKPAASPVAKTDDAKKDDAPDPLDAVADASKLTPPPSTSAIEKPAAKPGARPAGPAEDRVGDLLDGITPPPGEDPPH
jgi:hypothetical protein